MRSGEDDEGGIQPGAEGEAVELVLLVPREGVASGFDDRHLLAASPVGDEHPSAGVAREPHDGDALLVEQEAEHPPGLAREHRAQRHVAAERLQHPGLPHPLTAGVEMHVAVVRVLLDGDLEHRRGGEDDDVAHAPNVGSAPGRP